MLDALDFSILKDTDEFALKQIAFLPSQNAEDIFSQHRAARDAKLTQLAVAVPGNNLVVAIDCVKRERQAIDNCLDEAPLCLYLCSAPLDFNRQIGRCVACSLIKTRDVRSQRCLLRGGINQPAYGIVAVLVPVKGYNQRAFDAASKH